jgi:hypothetical protein
MNRRVPGMRPLCDIRMMPQPAVERGGRTMANHCPVQTPPGVVGHFHTGPIPVIEKCTAVP